jgi:hypothetical protein
MSRSRASGRTDDPPEASGMNFFLDLVFVAVSDVLSTVLSTVLLFPITLLTEWLVGLFAPGTA